MRLEFDRGTVEGSASTCSSSTKRTTSAADPRRGARALHGSGQDPPDGHSTRHPRFEGRIDVAAVLAIVEAMPDPTRPVIDLPALLRTLHDHCVRYLVLRLDELIEVKQAAGRPKDFEALAELVAIREQRE